MTNKPFNHKTQAASDKEQNAVFVPCRLIIGVTLQQTKLALKESNSAIQRPDNKKIQYHVGNSIFGMTKKQRYRH